MDFSSLSQSPAEVFEISIAGHVGRDKQEIVVVGSPEPPGAPVQTAFALPIPNASLECPRDDLLERRIAGQRVRQVAWIVWVGATELDGCGGPAALRITGVQIHETSRAESDAGGRVESIEDVLPIERTGTSTR